MTFLRPNRIVYTSLLAFAFAIPVYRWWAINYTEWRPLNIAYPLEPTTIAPTEFQINGDGIYEIVLRITRPPDDAHRSEADCLMGFVMGWDVGKPDLAQSQEGIACQGTPVVGLNWHLTPLDGSAPNSGEVKETARDGEFSGDYESRTLTSFVAKRGQRYRFEGRTSKDARSLAFVQPMIVAQPTSTSNEESIVYTLFYFLAAGVIGFIGLALLLTDVWKSLRDRRRAVGDRGHGC